MIAQLSLTFLRYLAMVTPVIIVEVVCAVYSISMPFHALLLVGILIEALVTSPKTN